MLKEKLMVMFFSVIPNLKCPKNIENSKKISFINRLLNKALLYEVEVTWNIGVLSLL
jgi:hypothetical protein